MEETKRSTKELVDLYKEDVIKLVQYLPYFEGKRASDVSHSFDTEKIGNTTLTFPVYDSTLLAFVKLAEQTVFMDRNYRYVYTRNNIRSHEDERRAIEKATIQEMDILGGILSKYVLGGKTRGAVWTEGVEAGIFFLVIQKMRELIVFWDKPIY